MPQYMLSFPLIEYLKDENGTFLRYLTLYMTIYTYVPTNVNIINMRVSDMLTYNDHLLS